MKSLLNFSQGEATRTELDPKKSQISTSPLYKLWQRSLKLAKRDIQYTYIVRKYKIYLYEL